MEKEEEAARNRKIRYEKEDRCTEKERNDAEKQGSNIRARAGQAAGKQQDRQWEKSRTSSEKEQGKQQESSRTSSGKAAGQAAGKQQEKNRKRARKEQKRAGKAAEKHRTTALQEARKTGCETVGKEPQTSGKNETKKHKKETGKFGSPDSFSYLCACITEHNLNRPERWTAQRENEVKTITKD